MCIINGVQHSFRLLRVSAGTPVCVGADGLAWKGTEIAVLS